jgi:hypothetical protein
MGLFSKKKEPRAEAPGKVVSTQVVLPLKDLYLFDQNAFVKNFRTEWGGKVSVQEIGGQALGVKKYLLSGEGGRLTLGVNNNPIPPGLVDISIKMARSSAMPNKLDDREAKEFKDNVGGISIENPVTQENARAQTEFAAQTLVTIMKHSDSAVGYTVLSAQIYRSRNWLLSMLADNPGLDASTMFVLLGNMHAVKNGENWLHTHGMDQFGCPDIETWFADEKQMSHFTELVGNAAMYVAENGPILKVGDTSEMGGDGVVYKIVEGRKDPDHQYGAFGAIGLSRVQ